MDNRVELNEEALENVVGGTITYTWNGEVGTIGINDYNPFVLVDKAAFIEYYNSVKGTMSDGAILNQLLAKGIAKRK